MLLFTVNPLFGYAFGLVKHNKTIVSYINDYTPKAH